MAKGDPVLPTLEVVQQLEELAFTPSGVTKRGTPTRIFPVAAIVLQVDGILREEWKDQVELSPALFAAYPKGFAPPPDMNTLVDTSYKLIDDESPARTQPCLDCVLRPGESPCLSCQGSGVMPLEGSEGLLTGTCTDCNGSGYVRCTTCDGARESVLCTVRYVNDKPVHQRRVFVPQVHPSLRPYLEAAIEPSATWPEEQRFDPEPSFVGSAYRGAAAVRSEEDFHGFFYGDALARCIAESKQAGSGLAKYELRTYAVPALWLVREIGISHAEHVAYLFEPDGNLRLVRGSSTMM